MNAQGYFDTYKNQSLLWAPSPAREGLRGQCVQAVCFYVAANGKPVIWADAYQWWASGQYSDQYERIANTASAVPQPGDIVIWGPDTPGSGGAGHIAVCLRPLPGTGTFISVDQNWGGKTVHLVTHNYQNVVGWLRFRGASPAPAPAPQGGDEMIANADQASKIYKMLRPNGGASQGEIDATTGHRSYVGFVNDAQAEIAARDTNLRAQAQQLVDQSNTINQLNQTVTKLNADDQADKQAIAAGLAKIGELTSQLEASHDNLKDLQDKLPTAGQEAAQPAPTAATKPSWITLLIAALLRKKSK